MQKTLPRFRFHSALLAFIVLLSGCSLSGQKSDFAIESLEYRRASGQGSMAAVSKGLVSSAINFDVTINYDAVDVVKIDFYWTFGVDDPKNWNYPEGQGPDYQLAGTDTAITGQYVFDTSFTGVNWVTVKGVAVKADGTEIVDKIWFNIDNLGPTIDIDPRTDSCLKSVSGITVRVVDSGSDAGTDYDRTSITLSTLSNGKPTLLPLNAPFCDGKGTYTVSPVRPLVDGTYTVSVVAYDNIGNPSEATATFAIDGSLGAAPVLTIERPGWEGAEVSGVIQLSYNSSQPLTRLVVDMSNSGYEGTPLVWGSFPALEIESPSQNGSISIDTKFTGSNPCFFRLFAVSRDTGASATSNAVGCQIVNIR